MGVGSNCAHGKRKYKGLGIAEGKRDNEREITMILMIFERA